MSQHRVVHPKGWARARGYSNGIVAAPGKLLFIAGQVGWDPTKEKATFEEGFAAQFERALKNVVEVLREAGGAPEHLTRMTVYVTDKREYLASLSELGKAWKRELGSVYPAMALVQVSALVEDRAKVEIEATAVLPSS
jgi:enamine deaminase RidA (YjgF/YER057c/UK114 family)